MISEDSAQIIDCICCWYDLLGYGAPFVNAKWDLRNAVARQSIERITKVAHAFWGAFSLLYCKRLHLNDGIISNYDIDKSGDDPLHNVICFVDAILEDYDSLNYYDHCCGFPGVRGVLTAGHRFIYDDVDLTQQEAGNIVAYHPREFQMNTAFSKAYIVEESGSRAGINGAAMYIDEALFDVFNKYSTDKNQYSISRIIQDDKLLVDIYHNSTWCLSLAFNSSAVEYDNRGIQTVFLRLESKHSYIDEMAKEAAHQEAARYILMDQMEEE